MNNLSSYCGLADAKKGASDKDLPVPVPIFAQVYNNLFLLLTALVKFATC